MLTVQALLPLRDNAHSLKHLDLRGCASVDVGALLDLLPVATRGRGFTLRVDGCDATSAAGLVIGEEDSNDFQSLAPVFGRLLPLADVEELEECAQCAQQGCTESQAYATNSAGEFFYKKL